MNVPRYLRQSLRVVSVVALSLATQAPIRSEEASDRLPIKAEFTQAIRAGNVARVRELAADKMQLKAQDADGNTPLIIAALYGNRETVEILLQQGADPNAANQAGVTPLMRAATDSQKVSLLLKAGAAVNVQSATGNTPLILAARRYGNSAAVQALLAAGADPLRKNEVGITALHTAAASGDVESARLLLDAGLPVDDFPEATSPIPDPQLAAGLRTPLMWAAFNNDLPMMRLLLDHRADPNRATLWGSPLSHACWSGSQEAAKMLIDSGAKVDSVDTFSGFTPLHWACGNDNQHADLVELLLKQGANADAQGGQQVAAFQTIAQTPLMLAAKRGQTAVATALLAAGAASTKSTAEQNDAHRQADRRDANAIADAAERALVLLQQTAAESPGIFRRHASQQDCISCHQQYLPMAAVGTARAKRLQIDTQLAKQQLDLMHRMARESGNRFFLAETSLQATFLAEPAYQAGYQNLALMAENVAPCLLTDITVHLLATIQAPDGRWQMNLPRPPIQSSDVGATALALLTLRHYGWPGRQAEFDICIERGKDWLLKVNPKTSEEAAMQLLGLHWSGVPAEELRPFAEALTKLQHADGGWSQLPTMASDAFATSQALYALHVAAAEPTESAAWQHGLRFLLATQSADGSWHVVRRAFPFQPTMPSGFPHGRDSWISAAATSWAVMAITQGIDPAAIANRRRPDQSKQLADNSPTSEPDVQQDVDFTQHIKPVLERSCLACHGPENPQSGYRVDSRETLLAGGALGEPAIVAGQSGKSPLVEYVQSASATMEMPPPDRRDQFPGLTPAEVANFRRWIDQGANWPADVSLTPPASTDR